MRLLLITALMLLGFLSPASASINALTVEMAQDHVDITTGFNGTTITLFGVQDEEGEIAIVITGPKRNILVRKKSKILGIWSNISGIEFEDVPGFYNYAVGPEEERLGPEDFLKSAGIGKAALFFSPKKDYKDKEKLKLFQEGLIRNMQVMGMFPVMPRPLIFLNDHFFKTTFYLPPNVPTGEYRIQAFLIKEGKAVEVKDTYVKVEQIGTSARIYNFANERSLTYGVLCVIFAMMIGWFSNAVRNRR